MKTAYYHPIALLVAASLLADSSRGFTPATRVAPPKTRATRLFVGSNDPLDSDLEYAFRGDDYGYPRGDDYGYPLDEAEPLQENRALIDFVNTVLRTGHNSFKNVEGVANGLLKEQPVVAFAIFVSAGLVAAYLLGFFMLDGGIESWNPAKNGEIPYWDEEILVMTRKIH